jgi:hypothetical protein
VSEYVIPPPETTAMSEPHPDPDRVSADIAALWELTATGVEVDGQVQVTGSTWFIYGHTSYDSEVVVGRYQDADEASEVLHAAQRHDR